MGRAVIEACQSSGAYLIEEHQCPNSPMMLALANDVDTRQ